MRDMPEKLEKLHETPKAATEAKPAPTLAERVVAMARAASGCGVHDDGEHAELVGDEPGPHHFAVSRGILRKAGAPLAAKNLDELVEQAKALGAFVASKPTANGGGPRPEPGDLVVLALGKPMEHSNVVCSISDHHIETLDGGEQARAYKVDDGRPVCDIGGSIAELRARQWDIVVPRDQDGTQSGAPYIVDSSHHGLVEKRHPPRVVTGWVSVRKLEAASASKGA